MKQKSICNENNAQNLKNHKGYNKKTIKLAKYGGEDGTTEYFNGERWKPVAEYKLGEKVLQFDLISNRATLTVPEVYFKIPCSQMIQIGYGRGGVQRLSPEQQIIIYKAGLKLPEAYEMIRLSVNEIIGMQSINGMIKSDFFFDGPGIELRDEEIKLMLAVICEGYFLSSNPDSKMCSIYLKKARKKNELFRLLKKTGIDFKIYELDNGYTRYVFAAPRKEKEFSTEWYMCSNEQLQLICDNILQWDGSVKSGMERFTSTSKETADFVQFCFSATGRRANLHIHDRNGEIQHCNGKDYLRKSVEYTVYVCKKNMISIKYDSKISYALPSDELKYCFGVPCHALILRCNNRVFVTADGCPVTNE